MKEDIIKKLNKRELHIYCDVNALCMRDNIEEELSASDYPSLDYYFKNGKVFTFTNEELITLDEMFEEWWCDETDEEYSWFWYFVVLFLEMVCLHRLTGRDVIEEFVENKWPMMLLLKDEEDDIIEELDNFDTVELDI